MRIAIISDTHSRYQTVETVLKHLDERGIRVVLHCGDIEDADAVHLFAGFTTHFVLGNCDHDRAGLLRAMKKTGATLQEPFGNLELEGRRIAWIHGDDKRQLRDIEQSAHFDYLFYGHTHQVEQHRTGPTLVVNPGALHRARPKSFVVLDLKSGYTESVIVE